MSDYYSQFDSAEELPLFASAAKPMARVVDPPTAQKASDDIRPKLSGLKSEFYSTLCELGKATSNEVAASITDDFGRRNTLRRRASDLFEDGWIQIVDERVCRVTGKLASVYGPVESERRA